MLTSAPVRSELVRDAALYLAAVLILGTASNLLPSRHLGWWGKGQLPPSAGTDFYWLDPSSADALRTALPHILFVDTRSAAEFAAGHVPGALRLDFTDLRRQLTPALLERLQRADTVILYGATDEADIEQLLAQQLRRHGLAPPQVLVGGFPAWAAAGFAVEGGSG
jgi:rhodanese-related sulfurtransferase